ncbi:MULTISPECIES: murein L,D-transpeptidase [unclassified Rhizobium]|uniref:L,D-transpeptidase family protein n=1 Tax=unclassified Rhizobium TaxID=2613769 RepID=UPI001614B88D|nr:MULTISPECIES: L,D-transpeptidase family protein [unclassified Rhizobium]MBB3318259.1 murein L,D-transpeptidase YcbB/YkuD [Rhizobium sp. BK181]MCS4094064.1 murein L,D-transpeptidase YcbB/YkuD [Rhizobium sp. BK176]
MIRKKTTKWVALVSAMALASAVGDLRAEPQPVLSKEVISTIPYTVPARRPAHISPRNGAGPLTTLFAVGNNQSRVLQEMGGLSKEMNSDIADAVEAYYSDQKAKLIWVDGRGPNAKAAQAISLLKQAGDWGLNPADYEVALSFQGAPRNSSDYARSVALFEASLSEKLLMFLQDNFRGRIDPNKLSNYYDFKRKQVDLRATLYQLSKTPDLMGIFDRLMPSNPKFAQLAAELHWLRTSGEGDASASVNKVIVAMEEMRWLPQEFPEKYVFINQPAYMAYYFDRGELALSMKAVIGQQDHQTNFFDATIKTVQFNPDWGVPQSIIRNEMLPHLKRDPSYLDREGYKVAVKGKEMSSAKVDWAQPLENISVVQPPGPDNALGQLKILFPNPHDIYMHDTPARGKFASQDRMFSHGCVRLENPRAMAAAVLQTSVEFVDQEIAGGEKKDMPVPEEIPVYVSYFTAWPTADGVIHYFDDIYGRDAQTLAAIAATSASRAQP